MNTETAEKYNDYTLALALFDGVPVVLFFINGLMIHSRFKSKLFLCGVISAFLGGASKAAWKIIVVKDKRDVEALTKTFKTLLPAGLTVMMASGAAGLITGFVSGEKSGVLADLAGRFSFRSCGLLALGTAGMGLMGYLGKHMDNSARSNWIEETINTVSQAAFLAATASITGAD